MKVLRVAQCYEADRNAEKAGISGLSLMENAGRAISEAIQSRWEKRPVAILCGPGNNGGDGYVIARLLKKAGWAVALYSLVTPNALKGDAAAQAKRWRGRALSFEQALATFTTIKEIENLLIVDAVFGAGLSKPLQGITKALALWLNQQRQESHGPVIVSVDIPSGIQGDSGHVLGDVAFEADLSVTFCCPKPGHLLFPGRAYAGDLVVADIGIPEKAVEDLGCKTTLNEPKVWMRAFPRPEKQGHKYGRGHLVVLGGDEMCGAAHLASTAARRMGAGLVSIVMDEAVFPLYVSSVRPGTLLSGFNGLKGFRKILSDPRKNAAVIGPGAGLSPSTKNEVLAVLKTKKPCILDADALSIFQDNPKTLFEAVKKSGVDVVLSPHGGEFQRLFPDLAKKQAKLGKLEVSRKAAKRAGCILIYKGADTVIAAPDGRAVLNTNAPPTLATAGTGDVLAGFIGGLLAQNMPAFEASSAATWLQGACADRFGPGLIAEDLAGLLPAVLAELFSQFS